LLTADTPSADALAAGGLQGLLRAPLLLTSPYGLSPETAVEINRLGKPNIHILGGEQMVRRVIEEQLRAAGHQVHRHAGPTRLETSISIAERHFKDANTAILAPARPESGDPIDSITDSVAAGALAAQDRLPLLFTGGAGLTPETEDYLRRSLLKSVVIVGNESAIREPVIERLEDLGLKTTRVEGDDRYTTAVAIAEQMGFHSPSDTDVVLLTEGFRTTWPAAYAVPFQAVRWNAPVLFANGAELPPATREYLEAAGSEGSTFLMCMPGVMEEACTAGRALLGMT
jgi:putative cell wall-binding protein